MSESTSRSRNNLRKAPKLRASCDACSSAKVRCTQTKPSCARCSKHDVPCVYGISRRSGKRSAESYQAMRKNAEMEMPSSPSEIDMDFLDGPLNLHSAGHCTPVIMDMGHNAPAHITSNGLPTPPMGMNMDFLDSPASLEFPNSPSNESLDSSSQDQYPSSPDSCPDLPDYMKQQLKDWAFDNMFMPNLLPTPQISPKTTACPSLFDIEKPEMHHDSAPHDYAFPAPHHVDEASQCFKPSSIYSQSPTSDKDYMVFSASQQDYSDTVIQSIETDSYFDHQPHPPQQPKRTQTNNSDFAPTSAPAQPVQPVKATRSCHCNETVISHLSSSPGPQTANKSYDMSLAQLQETLKLGSDVLNCACATSDASIPVALSLLAARIVSILERLCRRAREDDLVARGQAQVNMDGDRYSLGMYQIAKEDERRLKQEMLGLQIKKAELMVLCSRELVGRANGPMDTQAMVSEKLFSFLGEQVGEVKREWNARNGEV